MACCQATGSSLEKALSLPRVSICVPTYCQVDYLRETLRSVQAQDFENYELIISDDTPDDTVKQLVDSFGFDDRLRYYHNAVSLGSPKNWNVAVSYAQGEYIKLLHHDDCFSEPSALGRFVRLLDENPAADFAFSASSAVNITHGHSHNHSPSKENIAQLLRTPESLFLYNSIGAPSATIYRNGLGLEYDCKLKWLVDVDFYIRFLSKNPNFVHTTDILIATATNASHQITKLCKDNLGIDMYEHIYLYQKIHSKISSDSRTQGVWFRLFERYQVYSEADLRLHGIELSLFDNVLLPFFQAYNQVWIKRLPHRLHVNLPEFVKQIIRFFITR